MSSRTKTQKKYQPFVTLVESIAADLYTKKEWKEAQSETNGFGQRLLDMQTDVYQAAFESSPESFNGIQWINSDCGIPAWVRPGVEWDSNHD